MTRVTFRQFIATACAATLPLMGCGLTDHTPSCEERGGTTRIEYYQEWGTSYVYDWLNGRWALVNGPMDMQREVCDMLDAPIREN